MDGVRAKKDQKNPIIAEKWVKSSSGGQRAVRGKGEDLGCGRGALC